MAAAGATGLLATLAGCEEAVKKLKPAGQTVVYKTPQGELREGEMSSAATDETATRDSKPVVDFDQSVADVGDTNGQLSLSPDRDEVAYVDLGTGSQDVGIEIRSLSGGQSRYPITDFKHYYDAPPATFDAGNLLTLDWCPASGSDDLAVVVRTGYEGAHNVRWALRFTPGSQSLEMVNSNLHGFAAEVAWSPSCDRLAFTRNAGGTGNRPLSIANAGNDSVTKRVDTGEDPAWGETGIVFVRNDDLYLSRSSGTVRLTDSSTRDHHPVIFEQTPGESVAFLRGNELQLVQRIDQLGSNPDPSVRKIETDHPVETFDVVD